MPPIVFKRLFEVQILHDYFLTQADGTSFFDLGDVAKQESLKNKLMAGLYDARKLFTIAPTSLCQIRLNNYKLRFAPTALGFIVGAEVIPENRAADTTLYRPRIPIPTNISFQFSLKSVNRYLQNFSNVRLKNETAANFYFSNVAREKMGNLLPLSTKVADYQANRFYELGELADFDADPLVQDVKEATLNLQNNVADWSGAGLADHRFVNENDRALLPHEFTYSFRKDEGVTNAEFELFDATDTSVKKITKNRPNAFMDTALSFVKVDDTDENSADIVAGSYTLKITTNVNPEIVQSVVLNNDFYQSRQWGLLNIQNTEVATDFSLVDATGHVKARINAGVNVKHPVYELRFRNRRSYWRYKSDAGFSAVDKANTALHLNAISDFVLEAKEYRPMTQVKLPFVGAPTDLPIPAVTPLRFDDAKIFSDVFINKANPLLET